MPDFMLHSQLTADTKPVCDLGLCRVLLMNDRRFPWLILVPKRDGIWDLVDLLPGDQALLMTEISQASRALQTLYKPDKLNVAALGNVVPQLHIHVIARFEKDAAWPKPVWGIGAAEAYSNSEMESTLAGLAGALSGV